MCLCSSAGCNNPGITDVTNGNISLGLFDHAVDMGLTNGPWFTFHDGDSCGDHGESGECVIVCMCVYLLRCSFWTGFEKRINFYRSF